MTSPIGNNTYKFDRNRTNISDGGPRRPNKTVELDERPKTGAGERKLSMVSEKKHHDRKLSIPDRKASGGRQPSVEQTQTVQRRSSGFGERRSSANTSRAPSLIESTLGGRSTLIMTSLGQRPSTGSIRYENSYRMEPIAKLRTNDIRDCIKEVFVEELQSKSYVKEDVKLLSKSLAETIKQKVKCLGFHRYKVVSIVAIGQIDEFKPSVAFTSRCVWNEAYDNYEEYSYKNNSLYALGTIYLIYSD